VNTKEIGDAINLTIAAGKVVVDVRSRIEAAKAGGSDGGAKVTIAEAEAIVKAELATLEAPVLALVQDLIG